MQFLSNMRFFYLKNMESIYKICQYLIWCFTVVKPYAFIIFITDWEVWCFIYFYFFTFLCAICYVHGCLINVEIIIVFTKALLYYLHGSFTVSGPFRTKCGKVIAEILFYCHSHCFCFSSFFFFLNLLTFSHLCIKKGPDKNNDPEDCFTFRTVKNCIQTGILSPANRNVSYCSSVPSKTTEWDGQSVSTFGLKEPVSSGKDWRKTFEENKTKLCYCLAGFTALIKHNLSMRTQLLTNHVHINQLWCNG